MKLRFYYDTIWRSEREQAVFFFSLATRWLKYQQDFISKTESRGELSARMVESTKRFLIMSEKVRGHQYSV